MLEQKNSENASGSIRVKDRKLRPCDVCQTPYPQKNIKVLTCSKACGHKNKKVKYTKMNCVVCQEEFESPKKSVVCCGYPCRTINHENKQKEFHLLQMSSLDPENKVSCFLCDYVTENDLAVHLSTEHNISSIEYQKRTNLDYMSETYRKTRSERFSGEKNPAFGHGGRLSPYSTKFIGKADPKEVRFRSNESRKKNDSIPTRKSYWIKKGLTDEESISALKNRQSTFSLEKCIEKLGPEEGLKRWEERQEKWLKNLESKTDEEKARIRKAKIPKLDLRMLRSHLKGTDSVGLDDYSSKTASLYVVSFMENLIKIGFSLNPVERIRVYEKVSGDVKTLKIEEDNALKTYCIEQLLHNKFQEYSVSRKIYSGPGFSETYVNLNIEIILEEMKSLFLQETDDLVREMKNLYEQKRLNRKKIHRNS